MLNLTATAAFGLEAVVKREAASLGFKDIAVSDGRIDFTGGVEAIAKANIHLRSADRVLLRVGEFSASSFDELFENTNKLPWEHWITRDGKFTVTAKSVRSALFSVPDVQSIVKKAVVEALKRKYSANWFTEDGPEYTIQASLLKDVAALTIDTTGAGRGLHKRGYRPKALTAPLKETLASALIALSYWKPGRIFLDPVCGSGTLAIEAAMIAANIAPGLTRNFASEGWPQIEGRVWKDARAAAYAMINTAAEPLFFASDIDSDAIGLARVCADKAGVGEYIRFETRALKDLILPGDYGVAIANPPYGERLGSVKEVEQLYAEMGRVFKNNTWSVYVLTADEFFESSFGRKADAKRKLFNGMIKADYYQFHGKRPEKP